MDQSRAKGDFAMLSDMSKWEQHTFRLSSAPIQATISWIIVACGNIMGIDNSSARKSQTHELVGGHASGGSECGLVVKEKR